MLTAEAGEAISVRDCFALLATAATILALCQDEAFVITRCHRLADLAIPDHASCIGHEYARLARYVGAEIPGMRCQRQQCLAGDVVDFRYPPVDCLGPCLDSFQALRADKPDAIGDPVSMLLDRHRHVAQHRW